MSRLNYRYEILFYSNENDLLTTYSDNNKKRITKDFKDYSEMSKSDIHDLMGLNYNIEIASMVLKDYKCNNPYKEMERFSFQA